ncbi:MAG: hypothetical protein ACM34K_17120 [Bacillota bacterium]
MIRKSGRMKLIKNALSYSLRLKLYSNTVDPGNFDLSAADFTEVESNGYTDKLLKPEDWTITSDQNNVVQAVNVTKTFTFNTDTSVTVNGYYIIDEFTGELVFDQAFTEPKVILGSKNIEFTPAIKWPFS